MIEAGATPSLVVATHNPDKLREIRALLHGVHVSILSLDDFPRVREIAEDGTTLEENALLKARAVFRATGRPSLADDSGLEVFYLNGDPGVYSSRYSGPDATYKSNCAKLLNNLRGVPPRRRTAKFRSVIALVAKGVEYCVEGSIKGTIIESPRGKNGFGYDPVFMPVGYDKTFAEMEPATKDSISHRSEAIRKILPILSQLLGSPL
jgi:XTP/dITP diphosphohydrolase